MNGATNSGECAGLSGGFEDAHPQIAMGIDGVAVANGEGHGDVDEAAVAAPDHDSGSAGDGSMDRVVRQADAVDAVVRVGGDATDGVAGIDVFEVELGADGLEVAADIVAQPGADVGEPLVSGGIGFGGGDVHEFLARALGDDHDRVAPGVQLAAECSEQTAGAFQLKRHLGDKHEVYVADGERGVASDEA